MPDFVSSPKSNAFKIQEISHETKSFEKHLLAYKLHVEPYYLSKNSYYLHYPGLQVIYPSLSYLQSVFINQAFTYIVEVLHIL